MPKIKIFLFFHIMSFSFNELKRKFQALSLSDYENDIEIKPTKRILVEKIK